MSTEKSKTLKSKLKNFWLNYETKIVLIIGFILVAAVSFEAGTHSAGLWKSTIAGIDDDGVLLLTGADGTADRVISGDVEYL